MSVGQAEHGTASLSVTVQRIAVAALAILVIWALSHVVLLVFF